MRKGMLEECFLSVLESVDKRYKGVIVKARAPGEVKMVRNPCADFTQGVLKRRADMAGASEAERRNVEGDRSPTARAEQRVKLKGIQVLKNSSAFSDRFIRVKMLRWSKVSMTQKAVWGIY